MTEPIEQGKVLQEKLEPAPIASEKSKFSLAELASDYHFFTHGALFCFTGMRYPREDPVADWYSRQPAGTVVLMEPFRKPVFSGLHAPARNSLSWDHMVCGVRHSDWQSLWEYVGGVAAVDWKTKTFSQTFTGDIQILDPVQVERYSIFHEGIPKVTVTVFGVDTNNDRWEVQPPATVADKPTFVRLPPRPEVVNLAAAVFSGDISKLQYKDNPAFQPLLDKFNAIIAAGGARAGRADNAVGNRRIVEDLRRRG